MRNFLFVTLGIIIIAFLLFLLGYLVGRGYDLGEEPLARSASPALSAARPVSSADKPASTAIGPGGPTGVKIEKRETVSQPGITSEISPRQADLPYTIQVASSQSEEKSLALVNRLKTRGYPAYIEEAELKGEKWFRVRVGSFQNREAALQLITRLIAEEGLKDAIIWKR